MHLPKFQNQRCSVDKSQELIAIVPHNAGRSIFTLTCMCLGCSHTFLDKIKNKFKILEMKVEMSSPGFQ